MTSAGRWAAGIAALAITGLVIWKAGSVFGALAAALILAYVIEPAVAFLERRRVPRGIGVLLIALALAALALAVVLLVVPALVGHVAEFVRTANVSRITKVEEWPPWLTQFVAEHREAIDEALGRARALIAEHGPSLLAPIGHFLARITSSVVALVLAALNLVMVPVLAYYFIVDFGPMTEGAAALVPVAWRKDVFRIAGEVDRVLRAFLRGQLLLALAMGAIYAIGLTLCGTPLGIVVGLTAGLMCLVPYLGLALGLVPALLLNFMQNQSWPALLGVLATFGAAQFLEGWFLTPRLVGGSVGLHPAVVLVAVLLGGELFGFAGILLAVPGAAALSVFWHEALARYRASAFFGTAGPDGSAG